MEWKDFPRGVSSNFVDGYSLTGPAFFARVEKLSEDGSKFEEIYSQIEKDFGRRRKKIYRMELELIYSRGRNGYDVKSVYFRTIRSPKVLGPDIQCGVVRSTETKELIKNILDNKYVPVIDSKEDIGIKIVVERSKEDKYLVSTYFLGPLPSGKKSISALKDYVIKTLSEWK